MQRAGDAQERPSSARGVTWRTVQALVPPAGSVAWRTSPSISVAKHSETVGHETPVSWLLRSMSAVDQAAAPPVGLVETVTAPVGNPVATQRFADGHVML
jgi:hypothetical protein